MFQTVTHRCCPGQPGDGEEADPHDVHDGRTARHLQQTAPGERERERERESRVLVSRVKSYSRESSLILESQDLVSRVKS